jgi:hypothetical protein
MRVAADRLSNLPSQLSRYRLASTGGSFIARVAPSGVPRLAALLAPSRLPAQMIIIANHGRYDAHTLPSTDEARTSTEPPAKLPIGSQPSSTTTWVIYLFDASDLRPIFRLPIVEPTWCVTD